MRRSALLLALFCAACAPRTPDPGFHDDLAMFNTQYQETQTALRRAYNHHFSRRPDMRGLTIASDLEKWVLTPDTQNRIRLLHQRAIEIGAVGELRLARELLRAENERSRAIQEYWTGFPAPFWVVRRSRISIHETR